MEYICDICGSKYPPTAHYCGRCGVDLNDTTELDPQINPKKGLKTSKKRNATKDSQSSDKVIKWCQIHAMMNYHEMTLPFFLNLVLLLAKGRMDLGFCNCSVCNSGYRELQTDIINRTEGKNLKPSSKEIVSRFYDADLSSLTFHFPKFLNGTLLKQHQNNVELSENAPRVNDNISIEISRSVIENIILKVLSSEQGQQLIKKSLI